MRKSLRDIQSIERHLSGDLPELERHTFQQRLCTEPELWEQVERQRVAYRLIRRYGREQLRNELQVLHRRLMARPSFRRRIRRIFLGS